MAARVVELCTLVSDYIAAQSYSQTIVVERRNVPVTQVEESDDILVTVFPGEYRIVDHDRGSYEREYTVNVAIRNIIGEQDERTGQDALLQLVDEIEDSLLRTDMGTYCFRRISGEAGIRETMYTDQTVRTGMFMAMMDIVYVGAI